MTEKLRKISRKIQFFLKYRIPWKIALLVVFIVVSLKFIESENNLYASFSTSILSASALFLILESMSILKEHRESLFAIKYVLPKIRDAKNTLRDGIFTLLYFTQERNTTTSEILDISDDVNLIKSILTSLPKITEEQTMNIAAIILLPNGERTSKISEIPYRVFLEKLRKARNSLKEMVTNFYGYIPLKILKSTFAVIQSIEEEKFIPNILFSVDNVHVHQVNLSDQLAFIIGEIKKLEESLDEFNLHKM